jgi:cystathionine beta-lyase/cystathionine gamma-synthase
MRFEPMAIHAGDRPDAKTGAISAPIYKTSTFVFEDSLLRNHEIGSSNPLALGRPQADGYFIHCDIVCAWEELSPS